MKSCQHISLHFIIKIRDAEQLIHSLFHFSTSLTMHALQRTLRTERCPNRLLSFRFIPTASSKGPQLHSWDPSSLPGKKNQLAEPTAQMILFSWAQIHAPSPEVQGYWDQMFCLTSLYIEGPSAKAQIWLKLLPSPSLGFWLEPLPDLFNLCQDTMKAWCKIPRSL